MVVTVILDWVDYVYSDAFHSKGVSIITFTEKELKDPRTPIPSLVNIKKKQGVWDEDLSNILFPTKVMDTHPYFYSPQRGFGKICFSLNKAEVAVKIMNLLGSQGSLTNSQRQYFNMN